MSLQLIVKRSGLMSGALKQTITEAQYAQILLLISRPDEFVVARKPSIGFQPPATGESNART